MILNDSAPLAGAPSWVQCRWRCYQRHYIRQRNAAARHHGLASASRFPNGTRIEVLKRMRRTQQRVAALHAHILSDTPVRRI